MEVLYWMNKDGMYEKRQEKDDHDNRSRIHIDLRLPRVFLDPARD